MLENLAFMRRDFQLLAQRYKPIWSVESAHKQYIDSATHLHERWLQSLRDRQQAAAYLLAALGDAAVEPELLEAVLRDVDAALGAVDVGPIVSQSLHKAMSQLMSWLDDLGLELVIAVKK